MTTTHKERATAKGLTRCVYVTTAMDELCGWVSPEADLDGEFVFLDRDDGELLRIKGWLTEVNDVDEEA